MSLKQEEKIRRMPYQLSMPKEALSEIVVPSAIPEDQRLWVKQLENVYIVYKSTKK